MQDPAPLTDRAALMRNRHRAAISAAGPALFLQEAAADEVLERLTEVNRTFTEVTIVTGWPQVWQARLPGARVITDDETLQLAPQSADLVIHAMSLHWANDLVGQLVQCRRALRPDGLLIASLLGGQTLATLRAALAESEIAVTGGLSPRIAPMAEIRDLGGLLQRAGFALPVADSTPYNVSYATPAHLLRDLRAMGESNALSARQRHFSRSAILKRLQDFYPQQDGRIAALFEVIHLTGWAPSDTQQQPLRPGSAKVRLAEALGVDEFNPEASKD